MPSSRYEAIIPVLDIVTSIKPKSILDVGIGTGKYGMLFWEYLDVWNTKESYGENKIKIFGVEGFKGYETHAWKYYDKVWDEDIFKIKELPEVDLLFLGDVIEHFEKNKALELLRKLKWKYCLIVTPYQVREQGDVYGNELERHISQWSVNDFPNCQHMIINNILIMLLDSID